MKKRQIVALMLALIFVIGMSTACGGKKDDKSTEKPTNNGGDQVQNTDPTEIPGLSTEDTTPLEDPLADIDWSKVTELEIYSYSMFSTMPWMEGFASGISKFNEEIGSVHGFEAINRDYQLDNPANFTAPTTMIAAISSGDVWNLQWASLRDFNISMCYHKPFYHVDDFIDWNNPFYEEEFMENFLWRGNYYAIANKEMQENIVMKYDPKVFRDANLPTPKELYEQGKWNYEEVINLARAFSTEGKVLYDPAERPGFMDYTCYIINEDDSLTLNFDTQDTRDYFTFYSELRDIGLGGTSIMGTDPFSMVASPSVYEKILDGVYEYAPYPGKDGAAQVKMNGFGFMIPRRAKNVKASILFAQYMCDGMKASINDSLDMFGEEYKQYLIEIVGTPKQGPTLFPGVSFPFGGEFRSTNQPASAFIEEWNETLRAQINEYNEIYTTNIDWVEDDGDMDE